MDGSKEPNWVLPLVVNIAEKNGILNAVEVHGLAILGIAQQVCVNADFSLDMLYLYFKIMCAFPSLWMTLIMVLPSSN